MLCVQVLILLFLNFVLSFVVFTNQDSLKKIYFLVTFMPDPLFISEMTNKLLLNISFIIYKFGG